jgi:hypothetical protein
MNAIFRLALAGLLVAMILASPAGADTLYSQPPDVSSGGYYVWTSSFYDSNDDFYQVLDNFKVGSSSTIQAISWQGMYLDNGGGVLTNGTPNGGDWIIGLYTAGGPSDFPFTLLTSETIAASDVTETLGGQTSLGSATVDYYNEVAQLPLGIALQAGQTYYLSIFSSNSEPSSLWGWMSGSGGDGASWQYDGVNDATNPLPNDEAFTLYGNAVPEPSGGLLAAIGLACAGGYLARWSRAARRRSGH